MNMGYCRFENTVPDLRDCYDHIKDDDLSESEKMARRHLVILCKRVVEAYGDNVG